MRNQIKIAVAILFALSFITNLKAQSINIVEQHKPCSIRGLSVVNDSTAWISGSNGFIATTGDGGRSWKWLQVKGYEKSDFRSIEAFSDKEAIIMSSGTPALVLKTTDGGSHWDVKYSNTDIAVFLDAMAFSDKLNGFIMGDPINKKLLLMETGDAGETWHGSSNAPAALPGEASFAASGTCLRVSKKYLVIVTGGSCSRELTGFIRNGDVSMWIDNTLPFPHSKSSQGAFSVAIKDNTSKVYTGGDYADDKRTDSVACYKQSKNLILSPKSPNGYQSCVEFIAGNIFLSTGTPGSNISIDGGKTWVKIDNNSFNVCRKANRGNLVLLGGNSGKIGILKL